MSFHNRILLQICVSTQLSKNYIPAEVRASKNSKLSSQITDHLHRHEERAEEHNDQSAEGWRFGLIPTRRREEQDRLKVLRARRLTQGETGGLERRLTALTGGTDILWEDKTETARNLHTRNIWTQTPGKQINTVALNWNIQSITHSAQLVQHKITQTQWN